MLFSDPVFGVFFALYFVAHLATPPRYRLYLLIVGSTIFYGCWKVEYIWLPYLLSAIAWGGVWYRCSVSTCNKKRLPLHFCSPDCWDAHLPDANHRGPLCIEERAPYRP